MPRLREISYRSVRVNNPGDDIKLRLQARRPKAGLETLPKTKPSAALLWHRECVRGINHKIVHPRIKVLLVRFEVGMSTWTSSDGDKRVVGIHRTMKNVQEDFAQFYAFACCVGASN
jgi:hypothetical protein